MPEFRLNRDGVELAGIDFGGRRPAVLLLHGLAGYAGEWRATAAKLSAHARVVATDARGHGASARRPPDLSPEATAADAAFAIEELGLAPAVVAGQSLGGRTAIAVAASRPDLVRGLIVAEADPQPGVAPSEVEDWLRSWPLPFATPAEAVTFFGGSPTRASTWAAGLEQRDDGWWPRFEMEVMVETLREAEGRDLWPEWERITCPALVVRGSDGDLDSATAAQMAERLPRTRVATLHRAGHDLHLDQPEEWLRALEGFLTALEPE